MPGLGVAVKHFCNFRDSVRQLGCGLGQRFRNPGKRFLRHGGNCLGYHGKKLTGGHADERQEMLGSLVLGLGFCCQLAQMFHHGVGVDFADGTDFILALVLIFALVLALALAQQAAGDVAEGAEPAFAFQAGLVFRFQFAFHLVLKLSFELVFELRQGFQLTFELICHDESSCEKWSNSANRDD
jgi:hypothetical protein